MESQEKIENLENKNTGKPIKKNMESLENHTTNTYKNLTKTTEN